MLSLPPLTVFLLCYPPPASPLSNRTQAAARTPATYLDSSIAYGEKLGWNVSFPERCWALLLQNLLGSLKDPMVLSFWVTVRQALNLELGTKIKKVRRVADGVG